MDACRCTISLPTYNEAENLPVLLGRIFEVAPEIGVIIVDDGSPDGTGEIAEQFAAENPRIRVIHRSGKLGFASAHRAAIERALEDGAEAVITMDADLSHDPAHLPAILDALDRSQVVVGSRYIRGGSTPGWPLSRRLLSRWGNWFIRAVLRLRCADCTSGLRGYRAEALRALDWDTLEARGFGFQMEVLFHCQRKGLAITEVPIRFPQRAKGKSKLTLRIAVETLRLVFRLARLGRKP